MDSIFNLFGIDFSLMTISILFTSIVLMIGVVSTNWFKRIMWDFFNTPYKKVEIIHDGIIRDIFYLLQKDIVDGVFTDKKGNKYFLSEIFNPIHERSNCIRYTFNNENALPYLTIEKDKTTIKGMNNYEVLTKTKDGKFFVITNYFLKNILEEHFVEKIKKELQKGWEAIVAFLSTPAGIILVFGVICLVGLALWVNK